MKSKLLGQLALAAMLLTSPILSSAHEGGSGVGGGVVFSMISWCDDASIMVSETRDEALSRLSRNNDKIGALRIFYNGLVAAASSSQDAEVDVAESLTYRAITRGVRLSQILGVPALINGGRVAPGLAGEKHIQGLLSFMDWYTLNIEDVANAVDRAYYIPYRGNQARFSTAVLEQKLVDISLMQLSGLESRFVELKSDRSSYFTKIPVDQFLRALTFISSEVASDLNESLFSSSLECQSKRLVKLSRQAQAYLEGRVDASEDVSKLNKFVLDLRSIMKQVETRTCGR